jgi:CheY-like chemotaxis protein
MLTDGTRTRILIADDEQLIADSLQMIVHKDDFEVTVAYDGKTAIEKARQFCPQIFLCDVMMPDMNGVEVAIEVRAILPACRILLFSGHAGVQDLLQEARVRFLVPTGRLCGASSARGSFRMFCSSSRSSSAISCL